jgi:hypothetical protein
MSRAAGALASDVEMASASTVPTSTQQQPPLQSHFITLAGSAAVGSAASKRSGFSNELRAALARAPADPEVSDGLLVLAEAFDNPEAQRVPSNRRTILESEVAARVTYSRAVALKERLEQERKTLMARLSGSVVDSFTQGETDKKKASLDMQISVVNNVLIQLHSQVFPDAALPPSLAPSGRSGAAAKPVASKAKADKFDAAFSDIKDARAALKWLVGVAVSLAEAADLATWSANTQRSDSAAAVSSLESRLREEKRRADAAVLDAGSALRSLEEQVLFLQGALASKVWSSSQSSAGAGHGASTNAALLVEAAQLRQAVAIQKEALERASAAWLCRDAAVAKAVEALAASAKLDAQNAALQDANSALVQE